MRTINVTVGDKTQGIGIPIGRRGETESTQIVFDVSQLIATYGDGTAVLMAKRPTDASAYPVTVERSGSTVIWTVSEVDTSYKGQGECEIFWYVGAALAKSFVYATIIRRDIGTTTEDAPDAYESWLDTLTALGAQTQENAQDAAQSAEDAAQSAETATEAVTHYPQIVDGTWHVWSENAWVDTGVEATGPQGPQGDTGATGAAGADAVTYVLEPSVSAIVYDPNAEEGARLTPSELTLTAYQIVNGVRSAFGADYIYMSYENADTQASWAEAKGAGAIEKVYTLTHQIPSYTTPGAEIMCDMRKGSTVVARVSVPIVSSGVNGEQGPQGETGATGPQGPQGDTGATGAAGADAVTYVLEPSVSAIVYDPNAEEGARLTPSELTLTAYQIVNGVRSAFGADYIYMSYENADTQASWAEAKGAGAIEKVYTLTHQIPSYTTPGAEIMCDMRKGSTVVARVSVPIVSSGVNGEQGPQGETGATGPAGPGVPSGGTAGQFLVKSSAADYDAAWVTLATWQGGSY